MFWIILVLLFHSPLSCLAAEPDSIIPALNKSTLPGGITLNALMSNLTSTLSSATVLPTQSALENKIKNLSSLLPSLPVLPQPPTLTSKISNLNRALQPVPPPPPALMSSGANLSSILPSLPVLPQPATLTSKISNLSRALQPVLSPPPALMTSGANLSSILPSPPVIPTLSDLISRNSRLSSKLLLPPVLSSLSDLSTADSQVPCTCGVFLTGQFSRWSNEQPTGYPAIRHEFEQPLACSLLGQRQCASKCLEVIARHLPQSGNLICGTIDRDCVKERAYLWTKNCNDLWVNSHMSAGREFCCKDGLPYKCPFGIITP